MTPEDILFKHLKRYKESGAFRETIRQPYVDAMNEYAAQKAQPLIDELKSLLSEPLESVVKSSIIKALNDYKQQNIQP